MRALLAGELCCGVKDVEQLPCRVPDVTATLTVTRYPGVAPPMW
jgi:hypothetical protein